MKVEDETLKGTMSFTSELSPAYCKPEANPSLTKSFRLEKELSSWIGWFFPYLNVTGNWELENPSITVVSDKKRRALKRQTTCVLPDTAWFPFPESITFK